MKKTTLLLAAWCLVGSAAILPALARPAQDPGGQPAAAETQPAAAVAEAPAAASGAKVWIGRYAEFEEYLASAPVEKVDKIPVGVTKPERAFFAPGGLAGSAALKHLPRRVMGGFWESYQSEIAAYKLDRILGLDMVPPTIERRVKSDLASLQLWVENCRFLKDLDQSQAPDPIKWAKQVCRQRVFDNLTANVDRNEGNLLVDDEWNLILIDHSRAFAMNRMPFEKQMTRIDRELYERLKTLDLDTLTSELKPWVFGGGSIKDILKRRDKIIARFDKLVQEKGEAAVFPF